MNRVNELANTLHYIATCLQELDKIMNLPTCVDCAKYGGCEYLPGWGHSTRYNCPLFEKDKEEYHEREDHA